MINPTTVNPLSLPSLPLEMRSQLPSTPCIYFYLDAFGNIQYIGRSSDPQQRWRWRQHHRHGQLESLGEVRIAWLSVDSSELLPEIESALIKWFNPPLNRKRVDYTYAGKFTWREAVDVTTCNTKCSNLQSRYFQTRIICN